MVRLALTVLCVLALAWFLYLLCRPADKLPVVKGYCPNCGMELPKGAGECPFCKITAAAAKAKKGKDAQRKSRQDIGVPGKVAIFVSICLVAAMVAVWDRLPRLRRRRGSEAGQFYHFRCSRCKRKLRYEITKAGRMGACPACKQACIFPDPARESATDLIR